MEISIVTTATSPSESGNRNMFFTDASSISNASGNISRSATKRNPPNKNPPNQLRLNSLQKRGEATNSPLSPMLKELKKLKKIKPFKNKPRNESNEVWKKIGYQLKKEKLEQAYYKGKITVEELNRLLEELNGQPTTSQ